MYQASDAAPGGRDPAVEEAMNVPRQCNPEATAEGSGKPRDSASSDTSRLPGGINVRSGPYRHISDPNCPNAIDGVLPDRAAVTSAHTSALPRAEQAPRPSLPGRLYHSEDPVDLPSPCRRARKRRCSGYLHDPEGTPLAIGLDEDPTIRRSRFSRAVIPTLQYWRNEKLLREKDALVGVLRYTEEHPLRTGTGRSTHHYAVFASTSRSTLPSPSWSTADDRRLLQLRDVNELTWPRISSGYFDNIGTHALRKRYRQLVRVGSSIEESRLRVSSEWSPAPVACASEHLEAIKHHMSAVCRHRIGAAKSSHV